jgi:LPS export ABC transporter protein LptC
LTSTAQYRHKPIAIGSCLMAIVLFALSSCKKEQTGDPIDPRVTPVQVVKNLEVVQTVNGGVEMRMRAPEMRKYSYITDSVEVSYDLYTGGFSVNAFTSDGELETRITSKEAKHITTDGKEQWLAYGDVIITNYIKQESMESDTVYWDRQEQKIYTNCYVRLTSPQGMMQGFGMESDEMARNAILLKPFDSYTIAGDSTTILLDSLNFVGPPVQRF